MKNLKLLFTLAMIFVIVIACKKDKEEETTAQTDVVNVEKSTVSAKWEVEGDSDYDTFEFNESGTYVVVKNSPDKNPEDDIILFGTYTIDGNLLILSNFGTIKVLSLSDVEISFAIKLLGETEYGETLVANKSEELPASTNTQLLCRTWKLVTLNGDSVAGTSNELLMVFYTSGTYVVTYIEDDQLGGLAEWKWFDSDENVICYSWDGPPNCEDVAEIHVLEQNLLEVSDTYFYYVMVPINNTAKSATFNNNQMKQIFELNDGANPFIYIP